MAVGAAEVARSEGIARYVVVISEEYGVFEYDIAERPDGVSSTRLAEALFSVALDIQAKSPKIWTP